MLFSVKILLCASFLLALAINPHFAGAETTHPVLLFPGWGKNLQSTQPFVDRLIANGVAREDIYILEYNPRGSVERLAEDLIPQLNKIIGSYPASTSFDVIGRSTGHFAALYSLVAGNLEDRVHKFVGLAGIAHGIDGVRYSGPWAEVPLVFGGEMIRTIHPFNNDFVRDFMSKNAEKIGRLEKCSLASPDDGFIVPYFSGRFSDGVYIEVPGVMHFDTMTSPAYFDAMVRGCFGGSISSRAKDGAAPKRKFARHATKER